MGNVSQEKVYAYYLFYNLTSFMTLYITFKLVLATFHNLGLA